MLTVEQTLMLISYVVNLIRQHTSSENGQDLAEYALLIGFIAVVVVAAVAVLGSSIFELFGRINTDVQNAPIP